MPTNLNLDDRLIEQALKLGHHKTKKDAVNAALKEYIIHQKQLQVKEEFGTFTFDDDFDYKKARKR